jgi:heme exporter protein D
MHWAETLMGGTVPLSEHEQRQLEQIEQALYADHPRLARIMRARDPRVHYGRRVREASVGFLIGVAALVAGLFLKYNWLSAVGLVIMLLSLGWAVASIRRRAAMVAADRKRGRRRRRSRAARQPANSGLMERLEERWRRRQEGNNR